MGYSANTRWIHLQQPAYVGLRVYVGISAPTYPFGSPILAGIHDENA